MRPLDEALRQKVAEANDPSGFRDLVLTAFGVRPEAQDFIRDKCPDFSIGSIPGYGGGWYPPASLEGKGRVVLARWQVEACIHESAHVWWHWHRVAHPDTAYALAYQVAIYATLGPLEGMITSEFAQFARGYYFGVGDWPGMYVTNGKKAELRQDWGDPAEKRLDMSLVLDWEIFAGFCSWTMGQFKYGPRVLPLSMQWIFGQFFTGEIQATPSYEGGVP